MIYPNLLSATKIAWLNTYATQANTFFNSCVVLHDFDWLLNIACLFVDNVVNLWSCAWSILIALIDFNSVACVPRMSVCLFWILIIIVYIFVLPTLIWWKKLCNSCRPRARMRGSSVAVSWGRWSEVRRNERRRNSGSHRLHWAQRDMPVRVALIISDT